MSSSRSWEPLLHLSKSPKTIQHSYGKRPRRGNHHSGMLRGSRIVSYSQTGLFLLLFLCQSEAFASQQSGGMPFYVRGGETSHKRATSTRAFVMQQPPLPPLFTTPDNDDGRPQNQRQQKNGIHKPRAVEFVAETKLPTDIGQFQLRAYRVKDGKNDLEPCVIYSPSKPPTGGQVVPIRIHDQCITSEVFRSQR